MPSKLLKLGALLALLAANTPAVEAQLQTGHLYGAVSDGEGNKLPGVALTLTGAAAAQVQVTDSQGQFRFLGLNPGSYAIDAQLEGFSPLSYPNIVINVGRNTTIELTMSAAVAETITITAESPLLDERRISAGNTVAKLELEKIPSARDPWAVLQSTPGVLTDRINVGGNESGQQSQYVGPGAGGDQAVWALDGMIITDMSATGSSPGYYDFDSFEEMEVTTGGSDATIATGGVTLNMVTKRGTNEWRGSARYLLAEDSYQSTLDFDQGDLGEAGAWNNNNAQPSFKQGNRIVTIEDWGAELGGPIVKDRLWVWGAYSKPKIDLLTVSDFSDKTTLEDWNIKFNAQPAVSNSLTLFAWNSDKIKIGRNAGPLRPQETTWDQSGFGDTPAAYKVEDSHVFGPSFYLTGLYSKVNGGFQLVPQGGDRFFFRDTGLQWHNSFFLGQIERPQEQYRLDGSSFFNMGSISHELKFGAGYREVQQDSLSRVSGDVFELHRQNVAGQPLFSSYIVARDGQINVQADYKGVFAQDTLSFGNLTLNAGLRYDVQGGDNLASSARAGRVLTELLPAVTYPGQDAGFEWETISPRIGLTYALGAERSTLLRASYSRFADQLASGLAGWLHPLAAYQYLFIRAPRGDGTNVPANLGDFPILGFSPSYNPETGGFLQSNAADPDMNAPLTDELLFGVEHAIRPEFVIGLNLNYRQVKDILEAELLVFDGDAYAHENLTRLGRPHRRDDYAQALNTNGEPVFLSGVLPTGETYSIPLFDLREGVTTRGGQLLENGDREQTYRGASMTLNKRLANRWMMRGNFTWSDWEWNIPENENEDPMDTVAGGIVDGTPVLQGSGTVSGSKGQIFINSEWSYALNAMYQVAPERPWGFNVAANVTGREGYPIRYVARTVNRAANNFNLWDVPIKSDPNAFRYDDVHTVDLRVEKDFALGELGVTLGADLFNALNESIVLQRQGILQQDNAPNRTGDHVLEILSPRVWRFGVKLSFR